jgi:hypothetical protein
MSAKKFRMFATVTPVHGFIGLCTKKIGIVQQTMAIVRATMACVQKNKGCVP